MSGSNPLTCQQECQQTDKCEFWTYDTSSGGIGLNCWLKSKGDYRIKNSDRASGPKYCGISKGIKKKEDAIEKYLGCVIMKILLNRYAKKLSYWGIYTT